MSYTNAQLAHVWAHQEKPKGRSSNGNFWFSGPTLYSYSTPIARIIPGENGLGSPVALITTDRHSPTTAGKHLNQIPRALGYRGELMPYFYVPSIGTSGGMHRENGRDGEPDHAANLKHFTDHYAAEVSRLRRSRNPMTRDHAFDILERAADAAVNYANAFNLDRPSLPVPGDADAVVEHVAARFTPEMLAKREAAAVKRAAAKEAREARLAVEQAEKRELDVKLWRSRELHYLSGRGPTIMRLKDAATIETSQGAEFPVADAIRAFRVIAGLRAKGLEWARPTEGPDAGVSRFARLGHFHIDRVEPSGNVRAGCHYVEWNEIEAMARTLKEKGYTIDLPAVSQAG